MAQKFEDNLGQVLELEERCELVQKAEDLEDPVPARVPAEPLLGSVLVVPPSREFLERILEAGLALPRCPRGPSPASRCRRPAARCRCPL